MNFLRIFFVGLLLLSVRVYAGEFSEAIKHKHFHVKPSKENLAKLHEASTLVISCVDFRLRDEVEKFLRKDLFLLDNYDEVALPGASLAFVQKDHEDWGRTINDTISILQKLHHIKRVIFVDHMECGAYKLIKGETNVKTKEMEMVLHKEALHSAKQKMKNMFPTLEVYGFIMDLEGNIEQIDL